MIPRPIYEALPYIYFLVGSGIWLSSESIIEVMLGIVLYCTGAQQWIWRTSYRRRDRIKAKLMDMTRGGNLKPEHRRRIMPRPLYELVPFAYIALGYTLSGLSRGSLEFGKLNVHPDLATLSALAFFLTGFIILMVRGYHRQPKASHTG